MSGPLHDLGTLRRWLDANERELRILCHEEARVTACLDALRESGTKQAIREALAELQHRVRSQRSSLSRRRLELEAAEQTGARP